MNAKQIQAAAEAVLFAAGEPLELSRLAQALEVNEGLMEQILKNLEAQLDERGSGLCLLRLGDRYQLCTRTDFAQSVRQALEIKRNAPLSQAAFEVLAVVAYNQPVTKSFVEQVRGVDCSGVVNTLCQKGLLEEKGRLELPGRPLLYGTTAEFLRCFSFSSLEDLPPLPNEQAAEAKVEESDPEGTGENALLSTQEGEVGI